MLESEIKMRATDKIQSKLVQAMFDREDTKKILKTKIYGGVSREENESILNGIKTDIVVLEYILDAITD
tara:strand:- start:127 stop:333 length:207 start_codon:yes stop_codon:yes gene_type:complete